MPTFATLQELPPRWAHFCLGVQRFILTDLQQDITGCRVLVGLSGGADSTALLRILSFLAPSLKLHIETAHLDHGLRAESRQDVVFCRRLCARLGVPLHETTMDVAQSAAEKGCGLEEAARDVRYKFYAQCLKSARCDWLILGHHADDLAEDVLMRLIRGAGWPELAGMPGKDSKRRLLRPLLQTKKSKLQEFLNVISQPWCEDDSNTDMRFFRNRIRHSVMPLIARENPSFAASLTSLRRIAQADAVHFATCTADLVPDIPNEANEILLDAPALRQSNTSIRLRAFKLAIERMDKGQPLAENLFQLEQAFCGKRTGKVIQFPGSVTAKVEKDFVRFFSISDQKDNGLM